MALLIRIYQINAPFFYFVTDYEYVAASDARLLYYEVSHDVPIAKMEAAEFNYRVQPKSGPLIPTYRPFQFLVVSGYRLLGGEKAWIPKFLTSLFWLVGGAFVYGIARKLAFPRVAAILSLVIYLFHPYAVLSSRSYMVDPVMVTLMLASLFMLLRYFESPSMRRLLGATSLSTLAIMFLPKCLFILVAAFLILSLTVRGFRGTFIAAGSWVFGVFSVGLPIFYYFFLLHGAGHEVQVLVWPLYRSPDFWVGWRQVSADVAGFPSQNEMLGRLVLFAAVLGIIVVHEQKAKAFLLALWLGYFVYGLYFTYHIRTHTYYSLPLLPVVALSLGAVYSTTLEAFGNLRKSRAALQSAQWVPVFARTFVVVLFCQLLVVSWEAIRYEDTGPLNAGITKEAARAKVIGNAIDHSVKVVSLAYFGGLVLNYYGEIGTVGWPTADDFAGLRKVGHPVAGEGDAELIWKGYQGRGLQYFVVTRLDELARQPSLIAFLRRYPFCQGGDYLIFDLRNTPADPLHCGAGGYRPAGSKVF